MDGLIEWPAELVQIQQVLQPGYREADLFSELGLGHVLAGALIYATVSGQDLRCTYVARPFWPATSLFAAPTDVNLAAMQAKDVRALAEDRVLLPGYPSLKSFPLAIVHSLSPGLSLR